eukprot:4626983-Lingulodinium_polyedra.AAC.1
MARAISKHTVMMAGFAQLLTLLMILRVPRMILKQVAMMAGRARAVSRATNDPRRAKQRKVKDEH